MSAEPVVPPAPEVTSAHTQSHPLGQPKNPKPPLGSLAALPPHPPLRGPSPRKQWEELRPGPRSPAAWKPLPQELTERGHSKPQEVSSLLCSWGSSVPSLAFLPVPVCQPHTCLVQAAGRKLRSHGQSRLYSVSPQEVTPLQCVPTGSHIFTVCPHDTLSPREGLRPFHRSAPAGPAVSNEEMRTGPEE